MMNFGVNMQGQHGSPWLTTVQQLTKNPNRNPVVIPREIAKHPFGHGSKPCFDIKVSGVYGSLWPLSQGITMYHRHRLWPIPVCGFFHPTINRWGPPVLASPCHMRGAQNLISLIKHLTQTSSNKSPRAQPKGHALFAFFRHLWTSAQLVALAARLAARDFQVKGHLVALGTGIGWGLSPNGHVLGNRLGIPLLGTYWIRLNWPS